MGHEKMVFGENIAIMSYCRGSIKILPENPVVSAAGYVMPIYIDNRWNLSSYGFRRAVGENMITLLKENNVVFDVISGIPAAGIPWAANLAYLLGTKMVFHEHDEFYEINYDSAPIVGFAEEFDAVASYYKPSPSLIVPVLRLANDLHKPFIYIRPKMKEHGMKKQVEGELKPGQRVLVIGLAEYEKEARKVVEGEKAVMQEYKSISLEKVLSSTDMRNKTELKVEDHITTFGSLLEEVEFSRNAGAIVNDVISISTYDFPVAHENCRKAGVNSYSIMNYDLLISVAKKNNMIKEEYLDVLNEWHDNPVRWSNKH